MLSHCSELGSKSDVPTQNYLPTVLSNPLTYQNMKQPTLCLFILFHISYEVRQFNSRNSRSVSLGCWVRQTRVLKHVWTSSNLHPHEPQTKWVVHSRAAKEEIRVRGYSWRKNEWQESGTADKHQVLCEDW